MRRTLKLGRMKILKSISVISIVLCEIFYKSQEVDAIYREKFSSICAIKRVHIDIPFPFPLKMWSDVISTTNACSTGFKLPSLSASLNTSVVGSEEESGNASSVYYHLTPVSYVHETILGGRVEPRRQVQTGKRLKSGNRD